MLALDTDVAAGYDVGFASSIQWALLAGGMLSAVVWTVATMMILKTTARTFVATMRQLAGTT